MFGDLNLEIKAEDTSYLWFQELQGYADLEATSQQHFLGFNLIKLRKR